MRCMWLLWHAEAIHTQAAYSTVMTRTPELLPCLPPGCTPVVLPGSLLPLLPPPQELPQGPARAALPGEPHSRL